MITRFIATTALALSLLATSASAQTAAELFQKGIYAQQTAGDADGAISIYRQIIASAGTPRPLAAQAQMQIIGALVQKGDLNAASGEFRNLLTDYSDQKAIIASVAARFGGAIRSAAQAPGAPPKLTKGTLENGVYTHTTTGTQITLPPGWTVTGDGMSSGGGEMVLFSNGNINANVYLNLDSEATADFSRILAGHLDYKVKQRVINGAKDYQLQPETVKPWVPGGHAGQQALSAVAQYTENGTQMLEYLTYVMSEKAYAYVFGDTVPSGIYMYQDSVDRLTSGIKLP